MIFHIQYGTSTVCVQVCGKGAAVTWEQRASLPYTMAVIKEIQRYADIAPTGLMHKAVCDVTLRGFHLPAGTLLMANYTSAHRSPEFWARPEEFYPEHFLDASGQLVEDKEGFMPYGLGERICPGKELAGTVLCFPKFLQEFCIPDPGFEIRDPGWIKIRIRYPG